MQRIIEAPDYPPAVGKVTNFQVADQETWRGIPDQDGVATFNQVRVTPANGSTVTYVNPLDPPTAEGDIAWKDNTKGWDKVPQNSWRKF